MATSKVLPDELKAADLHRFALRAAQLERARPIVTFWLEYYILQRILSASLQNSSPSAASYASNLMDKLETTKASNTSNDAITDDVAAKAYIENFALETFNRADESQRSGNVTKQTADTFMAAATFMDLLSIWGGGGEEVEVKSKFGKYHARRILQAIKNGEDPNATNPVVEEVQEQPQPQHELDEELRAMEGGQNGTPGGTYQAPSVENLDSGIPPPVPEGEVQPDAAPPAIPQQMDYQVSPIDPPETTNSRTNSVGGGYFPSAPQDISAPSAPPLDDMRIEDQPPILPPPESMDPKDFYNTVATPPPAQPSAPSPRSLGISSPARPSRPPPEDMTAQPPAIPPVQSPAQPHPPVQQVPQPGVFRGQPVSVPAPASMLPQQIPQQQQQQQQQQQSLPTTGFRTDDEANMAATKHAKWAISALNFEDVNTAVKELRLALQSLGAG